MNDYYLEWASIGLSSPSQNDPTDENLPYLSLSLHTISFMTPSIGYMHKFLVDHPLYLAYDLCENK